MNTRQLFLQHVAQTSDSPLALHIVHAEGCTLTDADGKKYIDLIGGISVANVGHRHPKVIGAIDEQLEKYLHVMVYGEFVQSPQVQFATLLTKNLPPHLNSVYFTNSGAEAVEGAMKLAKRVTGRTDIMAFENSYHGSTQGALSIIGSEYWRNAFRPLLPSIHHLRYNSFEDLDHITENTACVIMETVQAEAGIIQPQKEWITSLRKKCNETKALLVLDEIQCGFGRTGKMWGFQQFDIEPDILLLGKALGGGLPLGAFIASKKLMDRLTDQPVLGHITTFGGHPLSCVAGMAAFEVLLQENLAQKAFDLSNVFADRLEHPSIKNIRQAGMWIAVEFESFDACKKVIDHCIGNGVLTDWFLFAANCLRISPPLTISKAEIDRTCDVILESFL